MSRSLKQEPLLFLPGHKPKSAALTFCSVQTGQLQHAVTAAQRSGSCSCLHLSKEELQDLAALRSATSWASLSDTQNTGWVVCEFLA